MTHKELVDIAYQWIGKNMSAGFIFKELKAGTYEIPDILAFEGHQSTLIECKISRNDFLRDSKKNHRTEHLGMGTFRYYCCPDGMIKQDELPPKWGLLYANGGRITVIYQPDKKMECFEVDMKAERCMLFTALRRIEIRGLMKHIYEEPPARVVGKLRFETKPKEQNNNDDVTQASDNQ